MTKTINGLTVTTSVASGDFLAIWRAANNDTRKITKADFMGGVMTGAGTIATGGFTLTVPATGTASLLAVAQTYSALKTFSAGLTFGNETLASYDEGTWTPAIEGGTSNPTLTYTFQGGKYTRIGNIIFYAFSVVVNNITGAGSGDLRVTLPITVNFGALGVGSLSGVDIAAGAMDMVFSPGGGAYGTYETTHDNTANVTLQLSGLANGDVLRGGGFYFV